MLLLLLEEEASAVDASCSLGAEDDAMVEDDRRRVGFFCLLSRALLSLAHIMSRILALVS